MKCLVGTQNITLYIMAFAQLLFHQLSPSQTLCDILRKAHSEGRGSIKFYKFKLLEVQGI